MALTFEDLRTPAGPITQKLFPGTNKSALNAILAGYIVRAQADSRVMNEPDDAKKDPIARAMALHYAFTDVVVRMSAEPLTMTIAEKGSHGYSTEQIRNMRALADQFLAEAEGLMTPTSTAVLATLNVHVPTRVTF